MGPQLGWIGLGNMGRGMCKNLVTRGNLDHPLIVFNRTLKRVQDLCDSLPSGQSVVATSIDDVVSKSDIIFICVGDDAAVQETVDAALLNDPIGKLFVDCSTVHPDTTESLEQKITAAGAEFVACPVFGAPIMADKGLLICVLAGPESAVNKIKPYTTGVIGRLNLDFSGQPTRKASLLKVIGNTLILNMIESLSEGHVLAETSGLGADNLHQLVEALFPGIYPGYSGRMISGDYYKRDEPFFAVDLARKDARHAMDLAKSSGTQLKALEVADAHLVKVKEHMGARGDNSSIYGVVREEGGLKFEN